MRRTGEKPEFWDRYDHEEIPRRDAGEEWPDDLDEKFDDAPDRESDAIEELDFEDEEPDFEAAFDDEEPEPERGDFVEPEDDAFDDEELTPW